MLKKQSYAFVLAVILSLSFIHCGKDEFVKQEFSAAAQAPGFRALPAKVDIVVVPDNSGSITSAFSTIQNQLDGFITSLKNKNWDYHVMRSYMINPSPINQALVNPNFNSTTLPDGTPNPSIELVPLQNTISEASNFNILESIDASTGSRDDTYSNTYNNIRNAMTNQSLHFFRPDAILAIIVITNGAEYSVQSGHDPFSAQIDSNELQKWGNYFLSLKASSELLRFYPVAAGQYHSGTNGNNCLVSGGKSYIGKSYSDMLNYIPGLKTDFCDASAVSNVLSNIEKDLESIKEAFIFSNIVLEKEPIPSTIHIYKNGQEIPNDATNGWTFEGGPKSVYTVTGILQNNGQVQPFLANKQTGWVIKLNGSAQFLGSDQSQVTYQKP